jgi:hypothetical protein
MISSQHGDDLAQIVYRVTPGADLDWNLDPPSLSFSSKNRLEFHCDVVFWKNLDATDRTPEGVFVWKPRRPAH